MPQSLALDAKLDDPKGDGWFFVSSQTLVIAACVNLFYAIMCFLMIRHQAAQYHQRIFSYMMELLRGGVGRLPHYAALREGGIAKVDYEGVIKDDDDMVSLYKVLRNCADMGTIGALQCVLRVVGCLCCLFT